MTSCASVELIGLGQIEGPEDVILDRDDNLYCGNRHGDICGSSRPITTRHEDLRPYRRSAARAWPSTARQSLRLHRRHGALSDHAGPQDRQAHGRDQPHIFFGHRRFPAAACRRSRHRPRRPRLFQRGDHPLRDARLADRRAREPRQRPHHLLRPEHRQIAHRAARTCVPERHLHAPRRPVALLRRDLGLPDQAATGSTGRTRAASRS